MNLFLLDCFFSSSSSVVKHRSVAPTAPALPGQTIGSDCIYLVRIALDLVEERGAVGNPARSTIIGADAHFLGYTYNIYFCTLNNTEVGREL